MLNIFLRVTRPIPALVISVTLAWFWFYYDLPGLPRKDPGLNSAVTAMGVLAQISATMLGFMMAVLAILASISNTRLLRNMQRKGQFHLMLVSIFTDNLGFAAVTASSLFISFRPDYFEMVVPLVAGCVLFSVILFISSLTMLWQTLAHLKPSSQAIE